MPQRTRRRASLQCSKIISPNRPTITRNFGHGIRLNYSNTWDGLRRHDNWRGIARRAAARRPSELARFFDHVIATDASAQQIADAEPNERVEYRVAPAESSGLEAGKIHLIMVAQALHWFDLERFHAEVNRLLKPDGVFAASAYRFFHVTPPIDDVVNRRFYDEIVGPFWPLERNAIEKFEEIPFPYAEIKTPSFEMSITWKLHDLIGYLRTWSATQRFIAANKRDPLQEIESELRSAWGDANRSRRVVWHLALRVGVKECAAG